MMQMVGDAYRAVCTLGDFLLLLDKYFLTVSALEKLVSPNSSGKAHMEIVTKTCVAFETAPCKAARGRPPKKGSAVHLKELFLSHKENFQETEIELYDRKESIRYYCTELLWGQELCFVLVEKNGIESILASTSLRLELPAIGSVSNVHSGKQQIRAFCYRFW